MSQLTKPVGPPVPKSNKFNPLSYTKNVIKSMGYATIDTVKDLNPSIAEFADINKDLGKELFAAVKDIRGTMKRGQDYVIKSKIGEFVKEYTKAGISDLKTGKFYNRERIDEMTKRSAGNIFDGLEGDPFSEDFNIDINWDDDSGISDDVLNTLDGESEIAMNMTSSINRNAIESTRQLAMSNRQGMIEIQKQNEFIANKLTLGLGAINSNLSEMMKFNQDVLKTHAENAQKFYSVQTDMMNKVVETLVEISTNVKSVAGINQVEQKKSDIPTLQDINYAGVPDLKAYLKRIGYNAKAMTNGMGSMANIFEGGNFLLGFAGSPFLPLMKAGVKSFIPKSLEQNFKNLNENLEGYFDGFINKMNDFAESEDNGIKKYLGKLLGVENYAKTSFNTAKYNKGPIPYDSESKIALTLVLPSYLSRIESALTGSRERIFDYAKGKFVDIKQEEKYQREQVKNEALSASSDLRELVKNQLATVLTSKDMDERSLKDSAKKQKQLMDRFENMIVDSYLNGTLLNFNSKDKAYYEYGFDTEDDWIIIKSILQNLGRTRNGRAKLMRLNRDMNNSSRRHNDAMKQLEEKGSSIYNLLYGGGVDTSYQLKTKEGRQYRVQDLASDDKTVQEKLLRSNSPVSVLFFKDKFDSTLFDYIRNISTDINYLRSKEELMLYNGGVVSNYGETAQQRQMSKEREKLKDGKTKAMEQQLRVSNAKSASELDREAEEKKLENEVSKMKSIWKGQNYIPKKGNPVFNTNMLDLSDLVDPDESQKQIRGHFEYVNDAYVAKERRTREKDSTSGIMKLFNKIKTDEKIDPKLREYFERSQTILQGPANIANKIIDRIDLRLYESLYGREDGEHDGILNITKDKLVYLFNNFGTHFMEDVLKPMKESFKEYFIGSKLQDAAKEQFSSLMEKFKNSEVGNALDRGLDSAKNIVKNSMKSVYGKGIEYLRGELTDQGMLKRRAFNNFNKMRVKVKEAKDEDLYDEEYYQNTYNLMKNVPFSDGDNYDGLPGHARGARMINKTGLAILSEGEMVIPSKYNPFYKGNSNTARQQREEKKVAEKYHKLGSFPMYHDGTTNGKPVTPTIDPTKITEEEIRDYGIRTETNKDGSTSYYYDDPETGITLNVFKNHKGEFDFKYEYGDRDSIFAATSRRAGEIAGKIATNASNSVNKYIQESKSKDKTEAQKYNSELLDKALNDVQLNMKDYAPEMISGGLVGGGISLLTGAVGGPLLGAAVGAATNLVANSNKLQDWLFGELIVDENGNTTRAGNILSSKLSNNIEKYFPDMAKGGIAGGLTAVLPFIPGGPIAGVMVGSALGFAKNNDEIQDYLFGPEVDGKRTGGLLPGDLKERMHKAAPDIALGTIAGLVASPLGVGFGLIPNMVLGSALGFVSTTESFKTMLFGEADKDGKRDGGLVGVIKTSVIEPLKDFGKGLAEKTKAWLNDDIRTPFEMIVDPLKKEVGLLAKSFGNKIKKFTSFMNPMSTSEVGITTARKLSGRVFRPLTTLAKASIYGAISPIKNMISLPSKIVGGIGNRLRTRQIEDGDADYMTAQERLDFIKGRKEKRLFGRTRRNIASAVDNVLGTTIRDGYRNAKFDENIAFLAKNDPEQLKSLKVMLDVASGQQSVDKAENMLRNRSVNDLNKILNYKYHLSERDIRRISKAIRKDASPEEIVTAISQSKVNGEDMESLTRDAMNAYNNYRTTTDNIRSRDFARLKLNDAFRGFGMKSVDMRDLSTLSKYQNMIDYEVKNLDKIEEKDPAMLQSERHHEELMSWLDAINASINLIGLNKEEREEVIRKNKLENRRKVGMGMVKSRNKKAISYDRQYQSMNTFESPKDFDFTGYINNRRIVNADGTVDESGERNNAIFYVTKYENNIPVEGITDSGELLDFEKSDELGKRFKVIFEDGATTVISRDGLLDAGSAVIARNPDGSFFTDDDGKVRVASLTKFGRGKSVLRNFFNGKYDNGKYTPLSLASRLANKGRIATDRFANETISEKYARKHDAAMEKFRRKKAYEYAAMDYARETADEFEPAPFKERLKEDLTPEGKNAGDYQWHINENGIPMRYKWEKGEDGLLTPTVDETYSQNMKVFQEQEEEKRAQSGIFSVMSGLKEDVGGFFKKLFFINSEKDSNLTALLKIAGVTSGFLTVSGFFKPLNAWFKEKVTPTLSNITEPIKEKVTEVGLKIDSFVQNIPTTIRSTGEKITSFLENNFPTLMEKWFNYMIKGYSFWTELIMENLGPTLTSLVKTTVKGLFTGVKSILTTPLDFSTQYVPTYDEKTKTIKTKDNKKSYMETFLGNMYGDKYVSTVKKKLANEKAASEQNIVNPSSPDFDPMSFDYSSGDDFFGQGSGIKKLRRSGAVKGFRRNRHSMLSAQGSGIFGFGSDANQEAIFKDYYNGHDIYYSNMSNDVYYDENLSQVCDDISYVQDENGNGYFVDRDAYYSILQEEIETGNQNSTIEYSKEDVQQDFKNSQANTLLGITKKSMARSAITGHGGILTKHIAKKLLKNGILRGTVPRKGPFKILRTGKNVVKNTVGVTASIATAPGVVTGSIQKMLYNANDWYRIANTSKNNLIRRAEKNAAEAATKEGILAVFKNKTVGKILDKIFGPQKTIKIQDRISEKFYDTVMKNTSTFGGKWNRHLSRLAKIGKVVGVVFKVIDLVYIVTDFYNGYKNAANYLQILNRDCPRGIKVIAGLIKSILGVVSCGFLNGDNIIGLIIQLLTPLLLEFVGYPSSYLRVKQKEAKEYVDAFNEANQTNLTIEDFNNDSKLTLGKIGKHIKSFFTGKKYKSDIELAVEASRFKRADKFLEEMNKIDSDDSYLKAVEQYNLQGYSGVTKIKPLLEPAEEGFISQLDPEYVYAQFNTGDDTQYQTIGDSGCGPAVAAMAINAFDKTKHVTLDDTANYAINSGLKAPNKGMSTKYFDKQYQRYGFGATHIRNKNALEKSISESPTVLMGVDRTNTTKKNSPFGPNEHYVLATKIDGDKITIKDPEQGSTRTYDKDRVLNKVQTGIQITRNGYRPAFSRVLSAAGSGIKHIFSKFSGKGSNNVVDSATLETVTGDTLTASVQKNETGSLTISLMQACIEAIAICECSGLNFSACSIDEGNDCLSLGIFQFNSMAGKVLNNCVNAQPDLAQSLFGVKVLKGVGSGTITYEQVAKACGINNLTKESTASLKKAISAIISTKEGINVQTQEANELVRGYYNNVKSYSANPKIIVQMVQLNNQIGNWSGEKYAKYCKQAIEESKDSYSLFYTALHRLIERDSYWSQYIGRIESTHNYLSSKTIQSTSLSNVSSLQLIKYNTLGNITTTNPDEGLNRMQWDTDAGSTWIEQLLSKAAKLPEYWFGYTDDTVADLFNNLEVTNGNLTAEEIQQQLQNDINSIDEQIRNGASDDIKMQAFINMVTNYPEEALRNPYVKLFAINIAKKFGNNELANTIANAPNDNVLLSAYKYLITLYGDKCDTQTKNSKIVEGGNDYKQYVYDRAGVQLTDEDVQKGINQTNKKFLDKYGNSTDWNGVSEEYQKSLNQAKTGSKSTTLTTHQKLVTDIAPKVGYDYSDKYYSADKLLKDYYEYMSVMKRFYNDRMDENPENCKMIDDILNSLAMHFVSGIASNTKINSPEFTALQRQYYGISTGKIGLSDAKNIDLRSRFEHARLYGDDSSIKILATEPRFSLNEFNELVAKALGVSSSELTKAFNNYSTDNFNTESYKHKKVIRDYTQFYDLFALAEIYKSMKKSELKKYGCKELIDLYEDEYRKYSMNNSDMENIFGQEYENTPEYNQWLVDMRDRWKTTHLYAVILDFYRGSKLSGQGKILSPRTGVQLFMTCIKHVMKKHKDSLGRYKKSGPSLKPQIYPNILPQTLAAFVTLGGKKDEFLGTEAAQGTGFISQKDPKYKGIMLGNDSVADAGCGPATAAMAINNMMAGRGSIEDHTMASALSTAQRYNNAGGTTADYFKDIFSQYGAKTDYVESKSDIKSQLKSGKQVVLMGQDSSNRSKANSPFGPNNHYVLATGLKNGKLAIEDPELDSPTVYDESILNNTKLGVAVGKGSNVSNIVRDKFKKLSGGKSDADTKSVADNGASLFTLMQDNMKHGFFGRMFDDSYSNDFDDSYSNDDSDNNNEQPSSDTNNTTNNINNGSTNNNYQDDDYSDFSVPSYTIDAPVTSNALSRNTRINKSLNDAVNAAKKIAKSGYTRKNIVLAAEQFLGLLKWIYGAQNVPNGVADCSAYVQYIFKLFGVNIARATSGQRYNGRIISKREGLYGLPKAKPGDLVFFTKSSQSSQIRHVGIVINNKQFIHLGTTTGCAIMNFAGYAKWGYVYQINDIYSSTCKGTNESAQGSGIKRPSSPLAAIQMYSKKKNKQHQRNIDLHEIDDSGYEPEVEDTYIALNQSAKGATSTGTAKASGNSISLTNIESLLKKIADNTININSIFKLIECICKIVEANDKAGKGSSSKSHEPAETPSEAAQKQRNRRLNDVQSALSGKGSDTSENNIATLLKGLSLVLNN